MSVIFPSTVSIFMGNYRLISKQMSHDVTSFENNFGIDSTNFGNKCTPTAGQLNSANELMNYYFCFHRTSKCEKSCRITLMNFQLKAPDGSSSQYQFACLCGFDIPIRSIYVSAKKELKPIF